MSENNSSGSSVLKKIFSSFLKIIKSFFKFIFTNKLGRALALIAILVVAGYLTYSAGERSGAKKQLAIDKKKMINTSKNPFGMNNPYGPMNEFQRRKTIIGNVTSVSDKSIEIKPKTGDSIKAKINKDTIVYGLDRLKTDYKAIKKDQLVYVTSNIEKDKSYTAIRIRIQK